MNLNTQVAARAELRLALLPKMLQAMEILRLPAADLATHLEGELAGNEALAVESTPANADPARGSADFAPRRLVRSESFDLLATVPAPPLGLREHLVTQLAWLDLSAELRTSVELAIDALDERGLLPLDDPELAALVGSDRIEEVRGALRMLEPHGIGARGPIEAMLQQLSSADPDAESITALLREHLADLARNRLPDVAHAIGASLEELQLLLERVRRLDPRPGASFGRSSERPIRPDLVVERAGDEFRVVVDDVAIPLLGVDEDVRARSNADQVDRTLRAHWRERVRTARDLIAAVSMRNETLARVATAIFARQRRFLEIGRAGVAPLKMSTIAADLGVHDSTISRAIAGKHVQTDFGVFALRELFDGARTPEPTRGGADPKGRSAILEGIRSLIAEENPRDPLSDDQIVMRLRQSGASISRRTVAKYRKDLGIRPSWHRREHDRR